MKDEQHVEVPAEGVYGVDIDDADADTWTGRYLLWASSCDHATQQLTAAGLDPRRVQARWGPTRLPPEGVPHDLGPTTPGWYRSRLDEQGWTPWQALPTDFSWPPSTSPST